MFKLGRRSRSELKGVDKRLVACVETAIQLTSQDFTVFDGLRSREEQQLLYFRGASQRDGYKRLSEHQKGRAVDLVPWIAGKPRWEWDAIYPIAFAMYRAARQQGLSLRWGGCWHIPDIIQRDITCPDGMKRLMDEYGRLRRSQKRKAFFDGPHYELARSVK